MMFNKYFYPTPPTLATRMWKPYIENLYGGKYSAMLEPSVGKGDLLPPSARKIKVYACETEENLRKIVSDRVDFVAHDFLSYMGGSILFDLIIMNPPFDRGDEHLLHAWDLLARGDLCCLLNAETVLNLCTERRKILARIIEENGSYELIDGAFVGAERSTRVRVAIVRLHKDQFIPEIDYNIQDTGAKEETIIDTLPAIPGVNLEIADELKAYVRSYAQSRRAFAEYCRAMDGLRCFITPLKNFGSTSLAEMIQNAYGKEEKSNIERVNDFSDSLRISAWEKIIAHFAPRRYMTERTEKHLDDFFKVNGHLDLTAENVYKVIGWIAKLSQDFMDETCEELFDALTEHTFENRGKNGWKTNSGWVVADKVIIPGAVEIPRYDWQRSPTLSYYGSKKVIDFERVLCWIDGKDYDQRGMIFGVKLSECDFGEWYPGTYCDIRCFKKGTMHLRFNNSKVLENFNLRACRRKNWLAQGKSK